MSLTNILKTEEKITTIVGEFFFIKNIGEGGNSEVFLYEKRNKTNRQYFAIKFLKDNFNDSQLKRFKDEFFLLQQIDSHPNIAKYYSIDRIEIKNTYYYILIMKYYDSSLNELGSIEHYQDAEEREDKVKKLFWDMLDGINHLHENEIIHRDIKPQNIFWNAEKQVYVLGDMGIAKFPNYLIKEAETHKSERLANWSFSPKEHLNSQHPFEPNGDIYSFGQVLNWYMIGRVVTGTAREGFSNANSPAILRDFDRVVEKCVRDNPKDRFQSVEEIKLFLQQLDEKRREEPKIDIWNVIHDFDDIIRKNFTRIDRIEETSDKKKISNFFKDFNSLPVEEFWIMNVTGGDNLAKPIEKISDDLWLFWGYHEIKVDKLIIYRNEDYPYKSFFIILTQPGDKFEYTNHDGEKILSECSDTIELANYWTKESVYIQHEFVKNGYFENFNGETIEASYQDFPKRQRIYKPYAFMVALRGTPIEIADKEFSYNLIEKALLNQSLTIEDIRSYEHETRGRFHNDIKGML